MATDYKRDAVSLNPTTVGITPGESLKDQFPDESPDPMEVVQLDPLDRLGAHIETKFGIAEQRRKRWEQLWYLLLSNVESVYRNWMPADAEDSYAFYPKTAQCVGEAQSKIMQLISPAFDRVWDLGESKKPFAPWLIPQPGQSGEAPTVQKLSQKAADLMREKIEDDFEATDFEKSVTQPLAMSLPIYGTGCVFGPVANPKPKVRYVNVSAFKDGGLLSQLDPAGNPDTDLNDLSDAVQKAVESGQDWVPVEDPDDKRRAMYFFEPVWNIYPDPDGETVKRMEYFFIRDHYARAFVRGLLNDPTFIHENVERLLEENPHGDYLSAWWENGVNGPTDKDRYTLKRFYGFMCAKDFEEMGLDPDVFAATEEEACYEIWKSSRHILKVKRRDFNPDELPLKMVPMMRRDGCAWGRGTAETAKDLQEVLNSLLRAMHDNIRHTSGINVVVDMNAIVPGTDLSIRGRKVWPVRSTEFSRNTDPVKAFSLPTIQSELMQVFTMFDKMLPLICSLPRMLMNTPDAMGSGIRTTEMLSMLYEAAENFIKLVIGNFDTDYFGPVIREMYDWNMKYSDTPGIHGDFQVVCLGVKGAIAREIAGKRALDFYGISQQIGMPDRFDDVEMYRAIARGMGLDDSKAVLGTKDYLAKQRYLLALKQAQQNAEGGDDARDRAEASVRDVLANVGKTIPDTNPMWVPAMEKIYKQLGQFDDRVGAALAIWGQKLALDYERAGAANPQEVQAFTSPFAPGKAQTATDQPQLPQGPEDQAAAGQPMPENIPSAEPVAPPLPPTSTQAPH